MITSLIEARRIIEPEAAALAAMRATALDLVAVEQAYLGMERNLRVNLAACCEAALKFHVSLVAASHNNFFTFEAATFCQRLSASPAADFDLFGK